MFLQGVLQLYADFILHVVLGTLRHSRSQTPQKITYSNDAKCIVTYCDEATFCSRNLVAFVCLDTISGKLL